MSARRTSRLTCCVASQVPDAFQRGVKRLVEFCFFGVFQEVQESSSALSANEDVVGSGEVPQMAWVQRQNNRTTL